MSESFSQELRTALDAVRIASRICCHVQATLAGEALEKKDQSPVTIADYASQAVICKQIRGRFSQDLIVGEEDAAELRQPDHAEFLKRIVAEIQRIGISADPADILNWIDAGHHDATADRYWTLDPIDGTKGFLRKEQFAISLALLVEKRIEVAVLACPNLEMPAARGAILYAVRGNGAWLVPMDRPDAPPQPLSVSSISDPTQARMCESVESGHSAHDQSAKVCRQLGIRSASLRMDSQAKYAVLARGDADLYLRLPTRPGYEERIWDHAGGVLIVEEAGGRVTDVTGAPLDFAAGPTLKQNRGVVVTNGHLHDEVIGVLRSVLSSPA